MLRTLSSALLAAAVSIFALNAYAADTIDTDSQTNPSVTTDGTATQTANDTKSGKAAKAHKARKHHAKKHKKHKDKAKEEQNGTNGTEQAAPGNDAQNNN